MQILEIVLYSHRGQKRVLPLNLGKTNIITGSSATGKSALIQIVDYCLGRKECTVPEGVIRETVSWFGLRLQLSSGQVFVARQNPPSGSTTTNRAYIEEGRAVLISPDPPEKPNTTIEAIEELLTTKIGISPNTNFPALGQTRPPLAANIRHALLYCFQQQGEIASKDILFHGQFDGWIAQAIKDTIPYLLGAIQEDRLALEQELARARRELRRAEQSLKEAESIKGDGVSKARGLYAEASQVGLLPTGVIPTDIEELRAQLQNVNRWTPESVVFASSEKLTQLQEERRQLQLQDEEKTDAINAAKTFAQEAEGFISEAREQELRLESIGLFAAANDHLSNSCPICSHGLEVPIPSVEVMRRSLEQLKANLESTVRERPRLRDYIENLEREREEIRQRIKEKAEDIRALLEEQSAATQLRELNVRRGRVIGRISLWLESVDLTDNTSPLKEDVRLKREQMVSLEKQLESGEKEERLISILNRIGVQMTEWANILELEHSQNPVRLDLSRLTVIVDRDRPIPLYHMGSGANWVGFHLITHLALHKHFTEHSRPVPRFLFLDQPSQAYYPPDQDEELQGALARVKDDDRKAVSQMYNLIFDVVESLAPNFQVIITDHADLAESRFRSAIVERWRGGQKLIPQEWIAPSDV